jgi:serine/threonine protein kinase
MKVIQVIQFKSSELNPEYNSVKSIEIDDNPFDSGAFGEVYFCNSVNGSSIFSKQVLKVFIDDGSGSAKRGYDTIVKLQEQIISHNNFLKQKNVKTLQQVNALGALPQFSYEGVLNGKKVLGYSANLLHKSSWLLFGQIFNEENLDTRKRLRNNFYNLPIDHRLKMAYDLVEAFSHLEQMKFIYADLNPRNFFVNEKEGKLCLIDYEGGAINDNPETFGKPGEWLAPEIQKQLLTSNSPVIKVDLNTDTWAVAIGVHFMLFPFHPLFFLKVRGEKEMSDYFKKYKWSDIDKANPNFRADHSGTYDWYIDKLKTQINPALYKALADTINNGYNNRSLRLSYRQWLKVLGGVMLPPKIKSFGSDRTAVISGVPVTLYWEIDNAHTIEIDNGIGDVTGMTEIKIIPEKDTIYRIKAIGHFGNSEASVDIKLFPTPVLESLKVPMPDFVSWVRLNPIQISSPKIDLSINITNLFDNRPAFTEQSDGLKKLWTQHKPKTELLNLSSLYESIKRKISK